MSRLIGPGGVAYAHTRPNTATQEDWDPLDDHLRKTAVHASRLAQAFAPKAAFLAGLWHDIGKFRPEFQEYLLKTAEAGHREDAGPRYEHAIVGAYRARLSGRYDLALAIAAHHGHLHDRSTFVNEVERAKKIQCPTPPEFLGCTEMEAAPQESQALWIRFLFSALVDADSLETELWDKGAPRWRCERTIPELLDLLEHHIATRLLERAPSPLDPLRVQVQRSCRERAGDPIGSFRLTVPTGGGKTISSMLFALHHARRHKLRRVIVVIPYTSIIEQTANVFRDVFGDDAVLEHHSNVDPDRETLLIRHCTENWDSPIVVTTSVQFFETLHSNHKRDLRKLHSIAESVVVLDEVQTFPIKLVKPIKDVLGRLNKHFRIATVHCSATQPLLVQPDAIEIVPDPPGLFAITKHRVQVNWDVEKPTNWQVLGEAIRGHPRKQVLAVVHSKPDAIDLANAVGKECIHLSTLLCPLHRATILSRIHALLKAKQPCLVVSTQLVEAGVDIDFPVVYRALAGIDSLAQAAGRCNREGTQPTLGEFNVFLAPSNPPAGTLREGFKITSSRLARMKPRTADIFDPTEYSRYFKELAVRTQIPSEISTYEHACNFPKVAELFKMIEDEGTPLIAPYGTEWRLRVEACRDNPSNQNFRRLQRYTVSIRKATLKALQATGCLVPLLPDSDSAFVVFRDHAELYSERFGFGGNGCGGLANLEA